MMRYRVFDLRPRNGWVRLKSSSSPHPTPDLFLDPSLRDLVERILPLATYYTAISSFIEFRSHLDFGRVNHALCAALREMLKVCLHGFSEDFNQLPR
jgi:hypothetical protein